MLTLITRRPENGLFGAHPDSDAALLQSSPHAHPADMVSLLPKREGGDAPINFPDAPGTYDLLKQVPES